MKHLFVTGAAGFIGRHATNHFVGRPEWHVTGCGRSKPEDWPVAADWVNVDVRDGQEMGCAVAKVSPDAVLHLAGTGGAVKPGEAVETNILGTLHLLEACRDAVPRARILLVGSAAAFGDMAPDEVALSADRPCRPLTFHGVTREAALELGRVAALQWGLDVTAARLFNVTGPGLPAAYAPAAFLDRLISSAKGASEFALRDGSAVRDFVDVRDVIRAFELIFAKGRHGAVYNVGTGKGTPLRDVLAELATLLGMNISASDAEPSHSVASIGRSIADPSALTGDTGWHAEVSLRQSLSDMIRARLAKLPFIET